MAQRIEGPYDFSKYGFTKYADGAQVAIRFRKPGQIRAVS